MAKFEVVVTRDVTESVLITDIQAYDEEEAQRYIETLSRTELTELVGGKLWERDGTPNKWEFQVTAVFTA